MTTELKVQFGSLSTGGGPTARLGAEVNRKQLSLTAADKLLTRSQCQVTLKIAAPKVPEGQEQMDLNIDALPSLVGVVDIKKFNVDKPVFTFGMTFNTSSVEMAELSPFAGQAGILTIERIGAIPDKKKAKKDNPAPAGATDDEGSTD